MPRNIEVARNTTEYATAMADLNLMNVEVISGIRRASSQKLGYGQQSVEFTTMSDLEQVKFVLDQPNIAWVGGYTMPQEDRDLGGGIGALIRIGRAIDDDKVNRLNELFRVGRAVRAMGRYAVEHYRKSAWLLDPFPSEASQAETTSQLVILQPLLKRKYRHQIDERVAQAS